MGQIWFFFGVREHSQLFNNKQKCIDSVYDNDLKKKTNVKMFRLFGIGFFRFFRKLLRELAQTNIIFVIY